MNAELDVALIHLDPFHGAESTFETASEPISEPLTGLRWYCEWLADHSARVYVLLPDQLRRDGLPIGDVGDSASTIWYGEDGVWKLPKGPLPERVWLINGERLPIIDWTSAGVSARGIGGDILVFDPSTSSVDRHYSESVLVDTSGTVAQLQRHYNDSPAFTDLWAGQGSVLVTSGLLAAPIVSHVLLRGWGLESIGALTRRFTVRWSETPCATSGSAARHVVTGPLRTSGKGGSRNRSRPITENVKATADSKELLHDTKAPVTSVSAPSRTPLRDPSLEGAVSADTKDFSLDPLSDAWYFAVKRAMDISISGIGLLLLSPLLIVVGVLVKLNSRGPVFFAHNRQGFNGKLFACLKFRSMSADADALQAKLRTKNEVDGPQFKMAEDPRVTPLGRWLRRLNFDELPQLINVLRGQMSLVGPRPSPDIENRMCPAWRRTRLSVKPGITGLWQVLRRRDCPDSDFQEWIYYDVEYARHRSLWLDAWILIYTPVSMFAPRFIDRFVRKLERRGICLSSDRRVLQPSTTDPERIQTELGTVQGAEP